MEQCSTENILNTTEIIIQLHTPFLTIKKELWSDVLSLSYDKISRTFVVMQRKFCCVDATNTIELAKRVDPDVKHILTYSGVALDTCYHCKDDNTGWACVSRKMN